MILILPRKESPALYDGDAAKRGDNSLERAGVKARFFLRDLLLMKNGYIIRKGQPHCVDNQIPARIGISLKTGKANRRQRNPSQAFVLSVRYRRPFKEIIFSYNS
jgi:hypothetical protein